MIQELLKPFQILLLNFLVTLMHLSIVAVKSDSVLALCATKKENPFLVLLLQIF